MVEPAVRVPVCGKAQCLHGVCEARDELLEELEDGSPAHEAAASEQYAANAEAAQALDLAVAGGEAARGGFEGEGDGG